MRPCFNSWVRKIPWRRDRLPTPVFLGFPGGSDGKECTVVQETCVQSLGRSPGEDNGYPLQYSCLENSMDRGAWWATVHGVAKSQTQLSDLIINWSIHFKCMYNWTKSQYYCYKIKTAPPWVFLFRGPMAPHSSTLAWKIPWTEESGGLQSMGVLESDTTERLHFHLSLSCIGEEMATHSNVIAWRIPGMGEPAGLPSLGSHRVGHNWSDLAAAAARNFDAPELRDLGFSTG